jgi:hypothetical protein
VGWGVGEEARGEEGGDAMVVTSAAAESVLRVVIVRVARCALCVVFGVVGCGCACGLTLKY